MILAWGDWQLFQELLHVLRAIADKYNVDVSNVSARWVLDQPATGVVIVGKLKATHCHEANIKRYAIRSDFPRRLDVEDI